VLKRRLLKCLLSHKGSIRFSTSLAFEEKGLQPPTADLIMTLARTKLLRLIGLGLAGLLHSAGCASRNTSPPPPAPVAAPTSEGKLKLGLETFDAAWKIIYETHFDTNFNGVDWKAVREELRPKAESARNLKELRQIIDGMLARLGQSHMTLIPQEAAAAIEPAKKNESAGSASGSTTKTNEAARASSANPDATPAKSSDDQKADAASANSAGDVGFDVRLCKGVLVVNRVEPNGPAKEAGVKAGWIVQTLAKRRVSELIEKLPRDLDARKLQFMAWRMAKAQLMGEPGSTVSVEFLNETNQPVTLSLKRTEALGEPIKLGHLPKLYADFQSERLKSSQGVDVGLIRFNLWMIPIAVPFDKAVDEFRQADGIIIDLRGNLGGLAGMVMGLSGHFLKERIALGTMKTRGSELKFFSNPRWTNPAGERIEPYSRPVAILTDSISLSAAEIFAGGMQAIGRARVFGETSPGQALPALWDKLPNGDVLYHAFADFVTPLGVRLEGRGVIPDEPVPLTREDLLAGRDSALSAALQWIANERSKKISADTNSKSKEIQ
jgi:carboxyl-terminal processing protease